MSSNVELRYKEFTNELEAIKARSIGQGTEADPREADQRVSKQIPAALEEQARLIGRLTDVVEGLRVELAPVVAPAPLAPVAEMKKADNLCLLANRIQENNDMIRDLLDKIHALLKAMQL